MSLFAPTSPFFDHTTLTWEIDETTLYFATLRGTKHVSRHDFDSYHSGATEELALLLKTVTAGRWASIKLDYMLAQLRLQQQPVALPSKNDFVLEVESISLREKSVALGGKFFTVSLESFSTEDASTVNAVPLATYIHYGIEQVPPAWMNKHYPGWKESLLLGASLGLSDREIVQMVADANVITMPPQVLPVAEFS